MIKVKFVLKDEWDEILDSEIVETYDINKELRYWIEGLRLFPNDKILIEEVNE